MCCKLEQKLESQPIGKMGILKQLENLTEIVHLNFPKVNL